MSQTFNPSGLSFFDYEGGKTSMPMRDFPLSSNTTYGIGVSYGVGDAMSFFSGNDTPTAGLAYLQSGSFPNNLTSADYIVGVFNGVNYLTQQNQVVPGSGIPGDFWAANSPIAANTLVQVKLLHLPDTIFKVQCNGPLQAQGAFGFNYNLVQNGGVATTTIPSPSATQVGPNPQSGQSQQFLMVNGGVGTSTGSAGINSLSNHCQIIGLAPEGTDLPSNNWTDPFPVVLVRINLHKFSAPTPSAG